MWSCAGHHYDSLDPCSNLLQSSARRCTARSAATGILLVPVVAQQYIVTAIQSDYSMRSRSRRRAELYVPARPRAVSPPAVSSLRGAIPIIRLRNRESVRWSERAESPRAALADRDDRIDHRAKLRTCAASGRAGYQTYYIATPLADAASTTSLLLMQYAIMICGGLLACRT